MKQQNYQNHTRLVTGYHFILYTILLAVLIGAVINLIHSSPENLYSASLLVALTFSVILAAFYGRSFALRAQDRAIRAEENFRHYIATGKQLDSRLKMGQIIALRFAGDDEFVALAKKAADENLDVKTIKQSIKNWKGDYNRA